jgi:alpha-L-fucosidase
MSFEPTLESIRGHRVPNWFHDAKLGIFIHWGLYSIPGWAPTTGPMPEVVATQGWQGWFRRNPYAEWYANSLRVPGSATIEFHQAQYGADFDYDDFAAQFDHATATWDPQAWADLFAEAGAKYVVLTTKHHDGYLLWPSTHRNPQRPQLQSSRDLVGDLTDAVRAKGLMMGLYYSGGLDWTFNDRPIADIIDLFMAVPQTPEYNAYSNAHLRELIERYQPTVLWNDIAYPADTNLLELFADYYNRVPDGVVNDRWAQRKLPSDPAKLTELFTQDGGFGPPASVHYDFHTPEYASFSEIREEKWESCRGLGFSFGYNRNEDDSNMLSATELIHSFIDIVSKNGNLLLNVGPMGDGTIPAGQIERLRALGAWLKTNGEAIYATRPWQRAEGQTDQGVAVRFTAKGDALYATLLGNPQTGPLQFTDLVAAPGATITLLGHDQPLVWQQQGTDLVVTLPDLPDSPAHVLKIA